jgi:UDP-glucose 4-epimerase
MAVCIVTGGAGFIGSHLAGRLIERGDEIYVLDDLSTGFQGNVPQGAVFYQVDIGLINDLLTLKFPDKIDIIYHLAGQSSGEASFDDPLRDIKSNYIATYNILKLAERKHCQRFIFTSSMSVYGEIRNGDIPVNERHQCNPKSYYGCNKLASEKLINIFVEKTRIKPTIFRLFNVYGPGQNLDNLKQGMVSIYIFYLMKNIPVIVKGSLDRFRDFIYVDDVVNGLIGSDLCEKTYGGVFNLGTGQATSVLELLQELLKIFKKDQDDFNRWVVIQGNTPGDIKGFTADISKLQEVIEWKPRYDLERGLGEMKTWIDQTMDLWQE